MSSLEIPLKWVKGRSQTFHGERSPFVLCEQRCGLPQRSQKDSA
ncbi:hypothetical protein [Nostoc sp. ChiQUE01b]|nr:hypothetical protein [Nostoc sp. ChiQUE01b]MDZ8258957.1 hypothetical protein [Nostoc sp. ChiQUE01b]